MDNLCTAEGNTTRLNARILELSDALRGQGGDFSTVIEDESRLLMKQVIRLTPPKTKAQGEAAIDRDLSKIFEPLNGDFVDDLVIEHGANNIDTWITTGGGEKKHLKFTYVDNTGGPMANFHHRHQDNRGRTGNLKRQRDPNTWYAPYVVSYENFEAYKNKVKSHVGRKKAAWGKSFVALGGSVSSWIDRHVSGARGEFHSNHSVDNPSVSMTNRAPGIGQDIHFVSGAMRVRREAIGRRIKLIISGYSHAVAHGLKVQRQARKTPESFQEAA